MFTQFRKCILGSSLLLLVIGCAGQPIMESGEQEVLGRGIVVGTLGSQEAELSGLDAHSKVSGQVVKLEGAAYVLREDNGQEVRLPLDENTSIDRPAHVGDHVEAYLDSEGRAAMVRNIDLEKHSEM